MVQLARENAAAVIHNFANATVSAELLAQAKTLNSVLLAHRDLDTRFAALCAGVTSSIVASDLRLAALASAHDVRIAALASRPSGLTAFAAPLALIDARVALLEAASADLQHDDDDTEATLVSARWCP